MARDYEAEYRVEDWPPCNLDPVDPPDSIIYKLEETDRAHQELIERLSEWREKMHIQRTRAWVDWHEANGWPDDPGYKARMLAKAGPSEADLSDQRRLDPSPVPADMDVEAAAVLEHAEGEDAP